MAQQFQGRHFVKQESPEYFKKEQQQNLHSQQHNWLGAMKEKYLFLKHTLYLHLNA